MDKEIKCCKCGIVINGGHYNTPQGIYCNVCWEKETPKRRNLAIREAAGRIAKQIREREIISDSLREDLNKAFDRTTRCITFCKKIASMEKGCAPSAGYMQELITEAENALKM